MIKNQQVSSQKFRQLLIILFDINYLFVDSEVVTRIAV